MEIKVAAREISDEWGKPFTFEYYLTVDLAESSRFSFEHYGVCIRSRDGSCARSLSLTTSATEIDELMTLLVDHCVTPASLRDVVEDWMRSRTPAPA